jgi:predicted dehydrogenase
MNSQNEQSRRVFLKESALATAGVSFGLNTMIGASLTAAPGPNERIRMGFIGVGNRGSQLLASFMANPDVEVAALCDVYEPYLTRDPAKVHPRYHAELDGRIPRMGEKFRGQVQTYRDFRRLLERPDVDAVCVATPDHWHALQTILALQAGKDVYVEKPLTITLKEGRKMILAGQGSDRIVQVGLNRRGSSIYRPLAKEVQAGKIGKVALARAYRVSNMYPDGIGKLKPEPPPAGLDWDMWLGPRPFRPYQYNIAPYKFRWWKSYSTQMGNWGVHYMDVCRWLMGEEAPVSISAHGGKYVLDDDRDIPDTMEVTFEFASGAILLFGIYEATGGQILAEGEVELCGPKGNLSVDERGYVVTPNGAGQFQNRGELMAKEKKALSKPEDSTDFLVRNFLDCVKSRRKDQLWCDLETGHRSTSFAHLANIALEMQTRIQWDPRQERITNCPEANALLEYEYRTPWKI